MVVLVEFTIPAESFPFGRAIGGDPGVSVTLEEMVPFEGRRIPFLWVRNAGSGDLEAFEETLTNSETVKHAEALTRIDDSVLYQVTWNVAAASFLNGIADSGGTIMEGHADGVCSFVVRFANHADLTQFHRFYQANGYPVHIDRVSTLARDPGATFDFDLTDHQREALVLALEMGYFAVPRESCLEDVAAELGISSQSASERIRRASEKIHRKALFGLTATDFDESQALTVERTNED